MGVLWALASAVCAGGGDFFGGVATKRQSPLAVTVAGHVAGVCVLLALIHRLPSWRDPWAAVIAGGSVAIGLMFLYRGLSAGKMGVVSPLSATGAALIPIAVGALLHQHIVAMQGVGIACCLVGMASLGLGAMAREHSRAGLSDALLAGVFFGIYLVALSRVPDIFSGLLVAKLTALLGLGVAAAWRREQIDTGPRPLAVVFSAGILDALSALAYVFATRAAVLPVAATVSTLYPLVTSALAAIALKERLTTLELFAAFAAVTGVSLMAVAGQ